MEKFPLPNQISVVNVGKNHDQIIIEPCFPGYGTTLANALRRVLLSSLPGTAVTAVQIVGVNHEFSTVPGVKEDVVDIILNIKRLRLKSFSQEPVKLVLKANHEGEVTAADIKATSDVEIINKDMIIATITDKKANLEMVLVVEQGRGYVPVESNEGKNVELGLIAIDSIFTPVVKVGYNVEDIRVGQTTNFDKITLDIETDGTVSPLVAVQESSKILVDHFNFIVDQKNENIATTKAPIELMDEDEEKKPAKKRGRPKKDA